MDTRTYPLISVCIPAYNCAKYIEDTILSVLNQQYPNLEILIQDNQSTDNTWNLIQKAAKQYPQLKIEQNQTNVGMAPNWNIVINKAKGEYIMLLSADDLLNEGFFDACLKIFKNNQIDIVTTNHFYLKDAIPRVRKINVTEKTYQNLGGLILLLNPFSINFTLFRKEVIEKAKINNNLFSSIYYTCDYDLWIRLSFMGSKIYYIKKPLATYRIHESNLSKQVKRMSRHTSMVILAHKKELKKSYPFIYRFTLLRFILRGILQAIKYNNNDKRLLYILFQELCK